MQNSKPNVLLISTDQQRFDSLGINGNDIVQTPHIDQLAGAGANFEQAIAQNPVSVPSRACIQTGRYTHQHGVTYMETAVDETPGLPEWEKTFWEYLKDEGYQTAAFGKIHMYPPKGFKTMKLTGGKGARWTQAEGLPIGPAPLGPVYAKWLEERHPGGYELIYEQRRRPEYETQRKAIENVLPLEEYVDWWIAENTIDYLKEHGDQPFFIWCGFCGPHGPYDPPKPYSDMYSIDEMPLPLGYDQLDPNKRLDEEVLKRCKAYYYGLVTLIDDMVGRIVELMRDKGIFDDTLIIYTTDHGDMLGDDGRFGKGNFLDTIIKVPLIIKPPAGYRVDTRVVKGQVEHIDIAPTIFDYLDLEIPETVQGESLRPAFRGEFDGKEMTLSEHTSNDRSRSGKGLRTDTYKYWIWGDMEDLSVHNTALFDLQKDPLERNNLVDDPAYADILNRMREKLLLKLMDSE